jgi:hypothetical protein
MCNAAKPVDSEFTALSLIACPASRRNIWRASPLASESQVPVRLPADNAIFTRTAAVDNGSSQRPPSAALLVRAMVLRLKETTANGRNISMIEIVGCRRMRNDRRPSIKGISARRWRPCRIVRQRPLRTIRARILCALPFRIRNKASQSDSSRFGGGINSWPG